MAETDPLKSFLLDRCLYAAQSADRASLAAAIQDIVTMWPDTFGNWTAEQADAAATMKEAVMRRLAEMFAGHSEYRPEWGSTIPR
jgi:hypothetical protein